MPEQRVNMDTREGTEIKDEWRGELKLVSLVNKAQSHSLCLQPAEGEQGDGYLWLCQYWHIKNGR